MMHGRGGGGSMCKRVKPPLAEICGRDISEALVILYEGNLPHLKKKVICIGPINKNKISQFEHRLFIFCVLVNFCVLVKALSQEPLVIITDFFFTAS